MLRQNIQSIFHVDSKALSGVYAAISLVTENLSVRQRLLGTRFWTEGDDITITQVDRAQKRHCSWDDLPPKGVPGANLADYPTDHDMRSAWRQGELEAEIALLADGMKLKSGSLRQNARWMKPWLEDPDKKEFSR